MYIIEKTVINIWLFHPTPISGLKTEATNV